MENQGEGASCSSEPDHVHTCISVLKSATTNDDRLVAIQAVARSFKTDAWTPESLCRIYDAIDFDFMRLTLQSESVDTRNVTLKVLRAFSMVADLIERKPLAEILPHVVEVIQYYDDEDVQNAEAVMYLRALSMTDGGQDVFVKSHAFRGMVDMFAQWQTDGLITGFGWKSSGVGGSLFTAIGDVIIAHGAQCWRPCSSDKFHALMNALADQYAAILPKKRAKFDECLTINMVMNSMPSEAAFCAAEEPWYGRFRDELMSLLCFRLTDEQRDPLFQLCAMFVDKLDVNWALGDTEDSRRRFLLLVQLSCVEMRMLLEDRTFEQAYATGCLLSACFTIAENAIRFLISTDRHDVVTYDARQQLYAVLTTAFNAVLGFFKASAAEILAIYSESGSGLVLNCEKRLFVLATVRVVGAWLAEETTALRQEVLAVLPLLLKICRMDLDGMMTDTVKQRLIYFLLPGFSHLAVEDDSRTVLLADCLPTTIAQYMTTLWQAIETKFLDNDCEKKNTEADRTSQEVNAINLCCGALMNIVVVEDHQVLCSDPAFLTILKLLFALLPVIDKRPTQLVLKGNVAVLGLLLLRRHAVMFADNERAINEFLVASVDFLWDAHVVHDDDQEELSEDNLGSAVHLEWALNYREEWDDLKELWFVGMQALSSLLETLPWMGMLAVESGWAETVVSKLSKTRAKGVEGGTCCEYEHFLVCLTRSCERARIVLVELGATQMCRKHHMTDLEGVLHSSDTV